MRQLRPPSLLEELGLSGPQRAAVLGNLVGRMAAPASERASWHWLRQRSALGELLGCDCETMGRNALQRHRDTIETRLLQRAADLYDRTSTCCEGAADRQPLARRGHSREKRHDCPPLTLGLALDASGFVRRSRALAGNVAEGGTLQAMPTALDALHEGLSRKGTTKRVEKVWQRIGRLQARHPSAAPHYAIDVQADDRGRNATAVAWKRQPLEGSGATHPGVHGLRTSSVGWDAERLWRTCVTRTDLEAVLRSLEERTGTAPDPPPQARAQRGPPVPVGARLPAGPGGPAAPAGGRGDGPLDDAAPSPDGPAAGDRGLPPGGRTHAARAQGDAGRRLAGRGPQAGRPAQTTKGKMHGM